VITISVPEDSERPRVNTHYGAELINNWVLQEHSEDGAYTRGFLSESRVFFDPNPDRKSESMIIGHRKEFQTPYISAVETEQIMHTFDQTTATHVQYRNLPLAATRHQNGTA